MNDPQNNLTSLSMDRCIRLAEIEGDHTVGAGSPDPQNEPRTCPYCDQPRQDTFENRFRFDCGTSLRADDHKTIKQGEVCQLRVELRAAQAEALELREALEWYEEQARNCRKLSFLGTPARVALAADGGERARAALAKKEAQP